MATIFDVLTRLLAGWAEWIISLLEPILASWPLAVLLIVYMLRHQLRTLLANIKRFGATKEGVEFECAERGSEVHSSMRAASRERAVNSVAGDSVTRDSARQTLQSATKEAAGLLAPFTEDESTIAVARFEHPAVAQYRPVVWANDAFAASTAHSAIGGAGGADVTLAQVGSSSAELGSLLARRCNLLSVGGPKVNALSLALIDHLPASFTFRATTIHDELGEHSGFRPVVRSHDECSIGYTLYILAPHPYHDGLYVGVIAATWGPSATHAILELMSEAPPQGEELARGLEVVVKVDFTTDPPAATIVARRALSRNTT